MRELLSFLKHESPLIFDDLGVCLDQCRQVADKLLAIIKDRLDDAFVNRDFTSWEKYSRLARKVGEFDTRLGEFARSLAQEKAGGVRGENEDGFTLDRDFTHTIPSGFRFLGDSFKVGTWREMLVKTSKILVDLDETRFLNLQYSGRRGRERQYVSADGRNLHSPLKIKQGVYVEGKASAKQVVRMIKRMLVEYDLDPNDYRVYLADRGDGFHG